MQIFDTLQWATFSNNQNLKMMNKFIDLNPKNEAFNNYLEQTADAIDRAANDLFKDKSYKDEYKAVFVLSTLLKYVCSVLSFATMVVALYFSFLGLFGFYASVSLAVAICGLFEALKTQIWSISSKHKLKYKTTSKALIFALIAVHVVSLGSSAVGAYLIPNLISEQTPSQATDQKEISIQIANQIAEIDKQLQNVSTSTTTSSTSRKSFANLTSQKAVLIAAQERQQEQVQKDKATAEQVAIIAKEAQQQKIKKDQILFVGSSIAFELLFIACSTFIAYYLFRTVIDLEADAKEANQTANEVVKIGLDAASVPTDGHQAPQATANVQKIGFKQGTGQEQQTSTEQQTEKKRLEFTRICLFDSCKKPFLHSIHNQKFCSNKCRKLHHENMK